MIFTLPGLAFLVLEPRLEACRCGAQAFLALEVELALGRAEAHAREIVGNHPQARDALEVTVPFRRIVTVHAIEVRRQQVVVAQGRLDFGRAFQCFAQRPLRRNASMYHRHVALLVVVHEFLLAQPFQQLGAVRGFDNLAQGVGFLQALDVLAGRQQVQVVVAQHAHQ